MPRRLEGQQGIGFADVWDGVDLPFDEPTHAVHVVYVQLDQQVVLPADAIGLREALDLGDTVGHLGHVARVGLQT